MNNPASIWRQSKTLKDQLGKTGKVLSFTTIFQAPEGFEHQVPYFVGIIKFQDGQTKALEIVDCNQKSLKIGLKVTTVIRRIGQSSPEELIRYGIKAKPARNASHSDAGRPIK